MIVGPKRKSVLTPLRKSSIEQFRKWRNFPDLRKYFREFREISPEMQERWFEGRVTGNPNQFDFEIRAVVDGEIIDCESFPLIGHASLNYVSWTNRTAEFGIYIGDLTYRSGGYGSDALRALISYGFQSLNLNRIWCEVFSNNDAIDIYRKLGFKDEGRMRSHHFEDGKYHDSLVLGLLREEWEAK
jgi:RimJ/RimL family protein N-acetyltransferase